MCRHKCFLEYTIRKIQMKLHPGPEWRFSHLADIKWRHFSLFHIQSTINAIEYMKDHTLNCGERYEVSLYNKKKLIPWLEDMNFVFSCWREYFAHSPRSFVKIVILWTTEAWCSRQKLNIQKVLTKEQFEFFFSVIRTDKLFCLWSADALELNISISEFQFLIRQFSSCVHSETILSLQ